MIEGILLSILAMGYLSLAIIGMRNAPRDPIDYCPQDCPVCKGEYDR